jgi:hypothetical protein
MINRTATELKYWDADYKARFYPGESPKPEVTTTINGNVITVRYTVVNRKCYDNLATPTRLIKLNGKRISLNSLVELLKSN